MTDDNKSYQVRNRATPAWSQIYDTYTSGLQLLTDDRQSLRRRGLTDDHIKAGGYVTKPTNNNPIAAAALGNVERAFDLDNVPGFFWDAKRSQRNQASTHGLVIPCRDIAGNVVSLLIRNADPKTAARNKYVAFSSAGKERGRPSRTATHCPIVKGSPNEQCGSTVRLVEGILKADVATALSPIYSLGLHGIRLPEDLPATLEELQVSTVLVSFDQETTVDVMKARRNAIAALQKLGYEVGIEVWPNPHNGVELKGIDDVLLHAPDQLTVLIGDKLTDWLKANEDDDPAFQWVYCIGTKCFVHRRDGREYDKSQFGDVIGAIRPQVVTDMIATAALPIVHLPTYVPGGAEFTELDGVKHYNVWRPSKLTPAEGDVTPFTEHVLKLIPDAREAHIFIQWLAHQVKSPGQKINWAVILRAKQGTGKSYFGYVMQKLLGTHNVSTPSNEELHKQYTGWAKNTQFVLIEELMADGRRELMNRLKTIITQPMVEISEKYRPTYYLPNTFNLLALTNHKDAALLDEDDRRYYVIDSKSLPPDTAYFKKIWEWTEQEANQSAILDYLLNYSMEGFEAKGHAPETVSKQEMIRLSKSPLEDWVLTRISEEAWPFFANEVFNVTHLQDACKRHIGHHSDYKWAKALETAGAKRWKDGSQVVMSDKTRRKLWILRRHEIYDSADDLFMQRAYEKSLVDMSKQPGGNPLLDTEPL